MADELFQRFAALHVPGDPIVLFNVWDAGSALAVAKAGASAIATGVPPGTRITPGAAGSRWTTIIAANMKRNGMK